MDNLKLKDLNHSRIQLLGDQLNYPKMKSWRLFAEKLGFSTTKILIHENKNYDSFGYEFLKQECVLNKNLTELIGIFKDMGRHDLTDVIEVSVSNGMFTQSSETVDENDNIASLTPSEDFNSVEYNPSYNLGQYQLRAPPSGNENQSQENPHNSNGDNMVQSGSNNHSQRAGQISPGTSVNIPSWQSQNNMFTRQSVFVTFCLNTVYSNNIAQLVDAFRRNKITTFTDEKHDADTLPELTRSRFHGASYVIVCITPEYKKAAKENRKRNTRDLYTADIYRLIKEECSRTRRNDRFIPVIMKDTNVNCIPSVLQKCRLRFQWRVQDKDLIKYIKNRLT